MHIRAYLKKYRLSQERFGKKIGVSQGLVWQWLEGRTLITAERGGGDERETAGGRQRARSSGTSCGRTFSIRQARHAPLAGGAPNRGAAKKRLSENDSQAQR